MWSVILQSRSVILQGTLVSHLNTVILKVLIITNVWSAQTAHQAKDNCLGALKKILVTVDGLGAIWQILKV